MKYKINTTIEMYESKDIKHCIYCPLKNNNDTCILQEKYMSENDLENWTWEDQMENCPLKIESGDIE